MPEDDMFDFTQALSELQMSESELQNLIARGELRAFRSGGTMKFRKGDVDMLKKERATEPTIIIPAAGSGEVNVDVPQDLGVDESAATVVPETTPGGAAPTVDLGGSGPASGTEEIVFEDSDLEILPLEGDASAATAEVTVAAEEPVTVEAPEAPAPAPRPSRRERRAPREEAAPAVSRRAAAAYAREPGDPIWTAILVFTSFLLVFVGSVFSVILWKGYYSELKRDKFVPTYLEKIQKDAKDWFNPE